MNEMKAGRRVNSRRGRSAPFYGLSPAAGFHILRNEWTQRSFLREQADALVHDFEKAVNATAANAPKRHERGRKSFLDRLRAHVGKTFAEMNERSEERRIERTLFDIYNPGKELRRTDGWSSVISYQIPLFESRKRDGWGHIDLLCLSGSDPVIVELKRGRATDTPLRVLTEVLANAVVVRENWMHIRSAIRESAEDTGLRIELNENPSSFAVEMLAPDTYWSNWEPEGSLAKSVTDEGRRAFARLREASARFGFPVHLATFDQSPENEPRVRRASVAW